ncbi:MAG: DUF2516 family protein [Bifidobacteriaceae bacterium]|jgi:hypothetical protein|nr:DUF2516 family protein [Bifidobacteriaceae bacterium]
MSSFIVAPWLIITGLLGLAALAVEITAFVWALKTPPGAYLAAGKLSKGAWVAITGVAMVIGLGAMPLPSLNSGARFGGLLSIAAVVAALVFIIDVRPAVKHFRGPSGRGPSGPARPGGW